MNTKSEKVLDSRRRIVVDLKRKHSDIGNISSGAGTQLLIPLQASPPSSDHNLAKRRKLDGPTNKYSTSASGQRLLKNYKNFKKSGIFQRLMYYCNDEWNDFSRDIVSFVNRDLGENPMVEVKVHENKILLDFVHMMLLDPSTGLHQPIAWIDVSGKCFFPEIVCGYDELQNYHDPLVAEPQGSNNINLHLEIEIHGSNDESSGESNAVVEQVEVQDDAALKYSEDDLNSYARASNVVVHEKCVNNQQTEGNVVLMHDHVPVHLDLNDVKDIFFKAISSTAAEIVEILRSTGIAMETRSELFKKQAEITKRFRGDANIRYAWLPCSRGAVSTILKYGVGHFEPLKTKPLYGAGIHLIPTDIPISTHYFDVDENGTRHIVLCRVIMGNMEPVHCGSNQFHPSSEDFDNGVDDVQNPKHFVVWTMNMNSHIFPECVVSFKMTSDITGLVTAVKSVDHPHHSTCHTTQINGNSYQAKTPRSPWMPFPMLFAAVADKVTPESMELVKANYALFRNKELSRDGFVKKLRVIVGDNLLKAAITSLQSKMSSDSDVEMA